MVVNVKYLGEKNNFNQEQDWIGANSIKVLEDYFLTDLYFIIPEKNIDVNFGIKIFLIIKIQADLEIFLQIF